MTHRPIWLGAYSQLRFPVLKGFDLYQVDKNPVPNLNLLRRHFSMLLCVGMNKGHKDVLPNNFGTKGYESFPNWYPSQWEINSEQCEHRTVWTSALGASKDCTPGYLEKMNHTGFLSSPQLNLLKCFVWCLGLTKVWWGHQHDTEGQFSKWKTRMIDSRNSDFSVPFSSLVALWILTVLGLLSLSAYLSWSKGGVWSGFAFWTLGYFTQSDKK